MLDTRPLLEQIAFPAIKRDVFTTLQVNLGYRCNLQCKHCHVNAGPNRTEALSSDNIERIIDLAVLGKFTVLDLTGGAPELHPRFRELVETVSSCGIRVLDRCNLSILEEPEQADLVEFLADRQVEIIASLPCYLKENVDAQRGSGVFDSSIRALRRLNEAGYGKDTNKILNLVYNPQGATLPPAQASLERDYKQRLADDYGIQFNQLFTITNMPIKRFGSTLVSKGEFDNYMQLLRSSFEEQNLHSVMCRQLVSVDWQGYLYDCDFNQMLGLNMRCDNGAPLDLSMLADISLSGRSIVVNGHCYGCTAGQGSSCGGAL